MTALASAPPFEALDPGFAGVTGPAPRQVAGAVGVSGASSAAEDSELAGIGAHALKAGV